MRMLCRCYLSKKSFGFPNLGLTVPGVPCLRANCILVSVNSRNRSEDGIKSITTLLSKPRSMHSAQPRPQIPEIWFQVLIIGRANAGKTSILQRICETTESPIVRKRTKGACHSEVCGQPFCLQVWYDDSEATNPLGPSVQDSNLAVIQEVTKDAGYDEHTPVLTHKEINLGSFAIFKVWPILLSVYYLMSV